MQADRDEADAWTGPRDDVGAAVQEFEEATASRLLWREGMGACTGTLGVAHVSKLYALSRP